MLTQGGGPNHKLTVTGVGATHRVQMQGRREVIKIHWERGNETNIMVAASTEIMLF